MKDIGIAEIAMFLVTFLCGMSCGILTFALIILWVIGG